jgi:serine/threonine protein kinase
VKRPVPFGKYYLLERINVGGMAEVFQAKTYGVEGFERFVAVKRILPNIAEDQEFISMFIDEAKIAVQLNHANIAQIFDLGRVDDSYFIALEYVHGKDLRAIFDRCQYRGEVMPLPQACFIIMKVCEGLDYAHNKRDSSGREMHLVHRDVSPQNVLISYDGEVKLVDFGIAKAVGKASKTQAGILKGKFGYMSPEQVRGITLDRRSDIFSMGIVLYEVITGERLFYGDSDFSTLEKVRNVEILPPSTYNRRIPEELEQIVLRALARDPDDRYEFAIDLHDDLQAFMYSSGAFYSRKDLAAWMKQTFAAEIKEESRKLEEFRSLPPPQAPRGRVKPPPLPPSRGNGQRAPAPASLRIPAFPPGALDPPPARAAASAPGGAAEVPDLAKLESSAQGEAPALAWDDDEVETQIYDKPSPADFFGEPVADEPRDGAGGG